MRLNRKTKALSLTMAKSVDVDNERRVTFVASDSSVDRDGEHMEVGSLRLPLKGGGEMRVLEIPSEGTEEVDIPLLADHGLWEVDKVIGSVRKAFFEDGQLIFEAGISNRGYAQDVFELVDEGHLHNSFSITVDDYDYDHSTGTISNGEIVEVSLVSRGSNRNAQVLAVKNIKEKSMDKNEKAPEVEEVTATETAETTEEAGVAEAKPIEEKAEANATDEGDVEKSAEETKENKEKKVNAKIVKSLARPAVKVEADQATTAKSTATGYLKSKQAMADFASIIANNRGKAPVVKKLWGAHLAQKGITGTYSLPTALEAMFFHTWEDVEADVLSTFRRSNRRAGTAIAVTGEGEGIRGKGHRKGDKKVDQDVKLVQRDLKGIMAYKKLPIDYIDLLEDEDGELLRFRSEELFDRLRTEVYTAAVLGDGRTVPEEGQPDHRLFNGSRGLWSIKADLDTSTGTGTGDNTTYAKKVATVIENVEGDSFYAKCVKTLAAVKTAPVADGAARPKVLVASSVDLTNLALSTDETGRLLFQPGTDFEQVFRAKIVELDGITGSGYDVIAYADQGYTLIGTDDMVRTDFDLEYNRDVMLVERLVAGSLEGYKAAAGYKSAN